MLRRWIAELLTGSSTPTHQTPGANVADAPITITLAQLETLRNRATSAELEANKLKAELSALKASGAHLNLDKISVKGTIDACLPIVRYAVANLPTNQRNWPWQALLTFADFLGDLTDDVELIDVLKAHAREARDIEAGRGRIAAAQQNLPKVE